METLNLIKHNLDYFREKHVTTLGTLHRQKHSNIDASLLKFRFNHVASSTRYPLCNICRSLTHLKFTNMLQKKAEYSSKICVWHSLFALLISLWNFLCVSVCVFDESLIIIIGIHKKCSFWHKFYSVMHKVCLQAHVFCILFSWYEFGTWDRLVILWFNFKFLIISCYFWCFYTHFCSKSFVAK